MKADLTLTSEPAFWQIRAKKKRCQLLQHLRPEETREYFEILAILAEPVEDRWPWPHRERIKTLAQEKLRDFVCSLSRPGRDGLDLLAVLLEHKSRFVGKCVWEAFRLIVEARVANDGQDPAYVGDALGENHLKIIADCIRSNQSFVVDYTPPTGPVADSGDFSFMNGVFVPEGTPVFLGTSPRLLIQREGEKARTHNTVGRAEG